MSIRPVKGTSSMASFSPSHLDLIERRFLAMTAGPRPLALDCAALGNGLPARELPLDEVRVLLLKRRTSWVSKDAVWQELVKRAHATPEPWTTVAAGMMMPGLKHIGGKLGDRYPGDRNDLDSEVLEGFLQALDIAEEGAQKIYGQLTGRRFAVAMRPATGRGDWPCPVPSSPKRSQIFARPSAIRTLSWRMQCSPVWSHRNKRILFLTYFSITGIDAPRPGATG